MASSFRLRKKTLLIGMLLCPVLLAGVVALKSPLVAQAHTAQGHKIFYVGHTAGTNSDCNSPGYTSVQVAVDAAQKGDTVYLCGTFAEQVIISKSITLTGAKGAGLHAPNPFPATQLTRLPAQFTTDNLFVPQAIVLVWGAHVEASINGLTIAGIMPGNGGCAENEFGALVLAGADVSFHKDRVLDIRDSNPALYGCQFGVAIQIGRMHWPKHDFSGSITENFVGEASITDTTVAGYQKNGIDIDGPGSYGNIGENTVTGSNRDTQLSPIIAQNGIEVARGAGAHVYENTVSGNTYTGPAYASASGIVIFGGCGDPLVKNTRVDHNTLVNNDVGIYLNNYSSDPNCTAPAATPTNDVADHNTISNSALTNVGDGASSGFPYKGYQAGIDDIGDHDTITFNTISGAGYVPARTTQGGPFVMAIDTTSFATLHPIIYDNDID